MSDKATPPIERVVIAANGYYSNPDRQVALARLADVVIAADGGANWLHSMGLRADLVVGDLDSAAPATLCALQEHGARLIIHPRRKDETDTELALLEAAGLSPREITLLGATGERLDHTLANILLLAMPELEGIEVRIFDGLSFTSMVRSSTTIHGQAGDVVSLLPIMGDAEGVTTEGLEYPLRGERLRFGPARGISNVLNGEWARVSLEGGALLLVHTPRRYLEEAQ